MEELRKEIQIILYAHLHAIDLTTDKAIDKILKLFEQTLSKQVTEDGFKKWTNEFLNDDSMNFKLAEKYILDIFSRLIFSHYILIPRGDK